MIINLLNVFDSIFNRLFQKLIFKGRQITNLGIVFVIWLLGAISDRLWYSVDNSVPAWDQADYLNGALNYWYALQTPQWLDGEWWRNLWLLSNKIPPLHYILTVPFINWFGTSEDAASLVMLFYSAILLIGVYGLGVTLFNSRVAIYAVILCQLIPGLYYYRLEFLLDYPLTAITVFSFWLLTLWKFKSNCFWLRAISFGLSFGLAILLKQTALFFLLIPLIYFVCSLLKNRYWLKILQLITSISISVVICYPWYRTNWLLILTSSKRATIDSAIAEGDPALNTLDAWFYYFKTLPYLLSWHLLLIPIVGFLLYCLSKYWRFQSYRVSSLPIKHNLSLRWLIIYLLGGYLLSSLNINKDARYILPLLPIITLFLALGLEAYSKKWRNYVRWSSVILAIVLMGLNIFYLPDEAITQILSPRVQQKPHLKPLFPHQEIVREIIDTEPYLRTTLGVLPSTPAVNQHNFSFYGGQYNFQVVGRQVGIREEEVIQDARSLNWFITKTGDPGSVPEAQATITELVSESDNFQLHKKWQLPDKSIINLYRAAEPNVKVIVKNKYPYLKLKIKLNKIDLPLKASVNTVIPVTYQWSGNSKQLTQGIVLLTWLPQESEKNNGNIKPSIATSWLHDRAIGMGMLTDRNLDDLELYSTMLVTENTAMLIPSNTLPGKYKLEARYLNRQTKKSYQIPIPEITITVDNNLQPKTVSPSNRELDLVTQLRTIAPTMGENVTALEPIFAQTARINQYDSQQDYLQQTEIALSYRLQHDRPTTQQKLDWHYAIALSQVLQQDVKGAIRSWQNITKIDPDNPYNYAYLAFVYLYDWHPKLATIALNKADALKPNIPEVKTLQGVAALMQGRLIKAWKLLV